MIAAIPKRQAATFTLMMILTCRRVFILKSLANQWLRPAAGRPGDARNCSIAKPVVFAPGHRYCWGDWKWPGRGRLVCVTPRRPRCPDAERPYSGRASQACASTSCRSRNSAPTDDDSFRRSPWQAESPSAVRLKSNAIILPLICFSRACREYTGELEPIDGMLLDMLAEIARKNYWTAVVCAKLESRRYSVMAQHPPGPAQRA